MSSGAFFVAKEFLENIGCYGEIIGSKKLEPLSHKIAVKISEGVLRNFDVSMISVYSNKEVSDVSILQQTAQCLSKKTPKPFASL